jgi:hypothetical protein
MAIGNYNYSRNFPVHRYSPPSMLLDKDLPL